MRSRSHKRPKGAPHRKWRSLYPSKVKVGAYAKFTEMNFDGKRPITHKVFVVSINKRRQEAVVNQYGHEERVPLACLAGWDNSRPGVLPGYRIRKV